MRKIFFILLFSNYSLAWDFTDKTEESGLSFQHGFDGSVIIQEPQMIASGLAIGDINGDGWDDIFVVTGETLDSNGVNLNPNKLYISQQNGKFVDMADAYNLSNNDLQSAGPLIIDLDNDGKRDLIFGSIGPNPISSVYLNSDNNAFTKIDNGFANVNTFSISAADTDKDGDLDLLFTHWLQDTVNAYWLNNGSAQFSDVTATHINASSYRSSFTPVFVDINNDNWVDLLLTSDFSSSKYFTNDNTGFMIQNLEPGITDENGMGAAVGDYDNDGDFDWFVTSIFDQDGNAEGNWGITGNRLYNNDGTGTFIDVSIMANVDNGYWGWGACFADFNNDMFLDIFHVNGFYTLSSGETDFDNDPSRLFINNGNGGFVESSEILNINDTEMGRSITCFDSDRDGDIDILIGNNQGQSRYYQNNLDIDNKYITIKLLQGNSNIDAIGAKIQVIAGNETQLRQVIAGGSFASSNPTAQHFGLANNSIIDSILITWPDGSTQELTNIQANQYLVVNKVQSVSGHVTDSVSNQAVNNILVQVLSDDGQLINEAVTDINGNYSIDVISTGPIRVVTNNSNYVNQAYPNTNCGLNDCNLDDYPSFDLATSHDNINFSLLPSSQFYPNLNGLWYNPDQSGHGLQVEIISSNNTPMLFTSWYVQLNGETIWLSGVGPLNKGIADIELIITSGTSFPPLFNSNDVVREVWGNLHFEFTGLNDAHISWQPNYDQFENGSLELVRLTQLSDLSSNTGAIDACQSGTYFNPQQDGHGVMLEVLGSEANSIFISWFTYIDNKQFWVIANGNIEGGSASLDAFYTFNTDFPPNFNSSDSQTIPWGTIDLTKIDDDNIRLEWVPNSNHLEFGSDSIDLVRLTAIRGIASLDCN